MQSAPVLERVFDVLAGVDGIDLLVLSHEGLLFKYRGGVEEAEALSATMSEHLDRVRREYGDLKYVVLALQDRMIVGLMQGKFLLVVRGGERVLSRYIPVITRLVSGDVVKCSFCGASLDAYAYQCPRCGKKYPFTLGECPFCGYRSPRRSCPSCGKPINYVGEPVKLDLTPLYSFSIAAALYGALLMVVKLSPLLVVSGIGALLAVGGIVTAILNARSARG